MPEDNFRERERKIGRGTDWPTDRRVYVNAGFDFDFDFPVCRRARKPPPCVLRVVIGDRPGVITGAVRSHTEKCGYGVWSWASR
jgi:hypothetical protein